jgi:hypothetical protein
MTDHSIHDVPEKKGSVLQMWVAIFSALGVLGLAGTGVSVMMFKNGIDSSLQPTLVIGGATFLCFLNAWLVLCLMRRRKLIEL